MSILSINYEESLYAQAEENADEYLAEKEFCLEDILTEQAEKDAVRINNGETINKATSYVRNYLGQITEKPELYCYHAGQKFWEFYCRLVRSKIISEQRRKLAIFPAW